MDPAAVLFKWLDIEQVVTGHVHARRRVIGVLALPLQHVDADRWRAIALAPKSKDSLG
jgi:hypothetical protein